MRPSAASSFSSNVDVSPSATVRRRIFDAMGAAIRSSSNEPCGQRTAGQKIHNQASKGSRESGPPLTHLPKFYTSTEILRSVSESMRSGVALSRGIVISNQTKCEHGGCEQNDTLGVGDLLFLVPQSFNLDLHDNGTEPKARNAER